MKINLQTEESRVFQSEQNKEEEVEMLASKMYVHVYNESWIYLAPLSVS